MVPSQPQTPLSPVKQALVEIRRLKEEVARERARRSEPIAVVGAGLRLPGGITTLEALWERLREGADLLGPIPADRWDHWAHFDPRGGEGRYYVQRGGFLEGVDAFDPEFFGIAPLEAETMDPQQRILLETAWEALEDAAIPPPSLRGSRTGVFVGIGTVDYHRKVMAEGERPDAYATSGTSHSVAAGRIAYLLDFRGPALSLDTACSSSLVTIHLACASLRAGESDLALAGGVGLLLSPELTVDFCSAGMLSREGRCATFDAAADGYVRSEGCGVVVLKRLSDARRDGDRILALVRGSAVGQDGRSSGLTAPSGPAQEAVIRDALSAAGLSPEEVSYVEAHGTGTSLGDPIEVEALGRVFAGSGRSDPVLLGSVKANLGHLEAAAGVAGFLKAVEVVRRREVPPQAHFRTPNPHIEWERWPLQVPVAPSPLPGGRPARAGVSSFGFSGTNAHVVLEEPPAPEAATAPPPPPHLLVLSAPQPDGLRALAARFAAVLRTTPDDLGAIAGTAARGRASFPHRLAVVAEDAREAGRLLEGWLEGESPAGVWSGAAARGPGASPPGDPGESGPERRRTLEALAAWWVAGGALDRESVPGGPPVRLPTYPFRRRRFWYRTRREVGQDGGGDPDRGGAGSSEGSLDGAGSGAGADALPVGDRSAAEAPESAPWRAAAEEASERAQLAPLGVDIPGYGETCRHLAGLAGRVGQNALVSLGAFGTGPGEGSVESLSAAAGIGPLYGPLVRRRLEWMVEQGDLEAVSGGFRWDQPPGLLPLEAAWEEVRSALAGEPAFLAWLEQSVPQVAGVLSGASSPLETLFPGGSFEMAERLYAEFGVLRYVNGIAAAALRGFLRERRGAARILEVGAGTGGTTTSLLRVLPGEGVTYTFTDVSPAFLERAAERFGGEASLELRLLDLGKDPASQGFEPGSFDVVVGANVLHALPDLRETLRRVGGLLAPGGMLLLVESTGHLDWHDVTTGLIEGWQHFTDDLRSDSPLLPSERWLELLREEGFPEVAAFPEPGSPAEVLRQHVLMARAAGSPSAAGAGAREAAATSASGSTASPAQPSGRTGRMAAPDVRAAPGAVRGGGGPAVPGGASGADAPARSGSEAELPGTSGRFARSVAEAVGGEREAVAVVAVREAVMEVLRSDPGRPPSPDARLMDLGLDSLMAVRLRNMLQERLELPGKLPATLVFDHPTIREIAALLLEIVGGTAAEAGVEEGAGGPGADGGRDRLREPSGAGTDAAAASPEREAELAALSDAEVEALLDRLDPGEGW